MSGNDSDSTETGEKKVIHFLFVNSHSILKVMCRPIGISSTILYTKRLLRNLYAEVDPPSKSHTWSSYDLLLMMMLRDCRRKPEIGILRESFMQMSANGVSTFPGDVRGHASEGGSGARSSPR